MYRYGRGCDQSYEEATKWSIRAQNHVELCKSKSKLGSMLLKVGTDEGKGKGAAEEPEPEPRGSSTTAATAATAAASYDLRECQAPHPVDRGGRGGGGRGGGGGGDGEGNSFKMAAAAAPSNGARPPAAGKGAAEEPEVEPPTITHPATADAAVRLTHARSQGLAGITAVQNAFDFIEGPVDVLSASTACRRWRELACTGLVWRAKIEREGILDKAKAFEIEVPLLVQEGGLLEGEGMGSMAFYAQIFALKVVVESWSRCGVASVVVE